jgi:hypothetical protein
MGNIKRRIAVAVMIVGGALWAAWVGLSVFAVISTVLTCH